ncbi:gypsy type transposase [Tanacetum coccineum]
MGGIMSRFSYLDFVSSKFPHFPRFLKKLELRGCDLVDEDIPSDFCKLSNLQELDLCENKFTGLRPIDLSQLPRLKFIDLSYCEKLINLPSSIAFLKANSCDAIELLEDLPTNYKWLWKVSLHRTSSKLSGCERVLRSMIQGYAIQDHFMSLRLQHSYSNSEKADGLLYAFIPHKHRTVTLLPTSVSRPSRELSESIEKEFGEDGSGGEGQEDASVVGHGNVRPVVPITDVVLLKRCFPAKRIKEISGLSAGKARSPGVLNKLLQDSRLSVEQGVTALPTLPFITSSVTASPLEEGGDHTDLSVVPVMTEATTKLVTTIATTVAIPADVGKDKSVPHPSVFGSSSSSEKTDRTLSLFTGRSGSGFAAGSIRAEEVTDAGLEEIYVPECVVTKGFELNDGRSCANMIDHFTPPAFFKTVRGMEHEQLFVEFNVSAKRNGETLAEEKDSLLGAKDKEIEELRSQLLKAKDESVVVAQLRARVSSLEAIEGSLRGEVASVKGFVRPTLNKNVCFAEIDECFSKVLYALYKRFHLHLLNVVAGRRWLLTHGMKLLMAKCLNSTEYIEALDNAFRQCANRDKECRRSGSGIENGHAGKMFQLTSEAYIPSAEVLTIILCL